MPAAGNDWQDLRCSIKPAQESVETLKFAVDSTTATGRVTVKGGPKSMFLGVGVVFMYEEMRRAERLRQLGRQQEAAEAVPMAR